MASPAEGDRPARRGPVARVLETAAQMVTRLAALGTLAAWLAPWFWLCELLCHYRLQFGLAALGAAAVFGLLRRPRWVLGAGLVAVVNLWHPATLLLPAAPRAATANPSPTTAAPTGTPPPTATAAAVATGTGTATPPDATLRLVSFNVLRDNRHFGAAVEYVRMQEADVLVLLEVDAEWCAAFDALRTRLPHRHAEARPDTFGVAIYSRWPLVRPQTIAADELGHPLLVVRVDHPRRPFTLLAAHPLPPISAELAAQRDRYLARLTKLAAASDGPTVVAGDLNVTSYAPRFTELVHTADLVDSRQGIGWQPTWPGAWWPLWIPIDHVLVSPEIGVRRRAVGPPLGSDHSPVIVDLELPAAADRADAATAEP